MKTNKSAKLTFIVALAAAVAAVTTLVLLMLRARSKRQALHAYNDAIDYDLDDFCDDCGCDCGCECGDACDCDEAHAAKDVPQDASEDAPEAEQ